ncbi:MAG: Sapep family Mn(2+)-dependent dipeptidase [Firmicutes bacterium]|nr:Sapep family Mn(2+)-dependent dipeptidase [Bacillota bacterium]
MDPRVDKWIEEHMDELIEDLRNCLGFDSVQGKELPGMPFGVTVHECLRSTLDNAGRLGFKTDDLDGYVGYAEAGEGSETLGILTHLDIVPAGDGWAHPPFEGVIDAGRLYGRGTLDDKGPAIMALYALKAVCESGYEFRRRVRIIFGCNEESGMKCVEHYKEVEGAPDISFSPDSSYPLVSCEKSGAGWILKKGFNSDIRFESGTVSNIVPAVATAWVGDIDPETIERIAKRMTLLDDYEMELSEEEDGLKIVLKGEQCHASMPWLGKNAMQGMIKLLSRAPLYEADSEAVKSLFSVFDMDYHGQKLGLDKSDASGRLTLNLGTMRWDEDGYELKLDLRVPNDLPEEYVKSRLQEAADELGAELTAWRYSRGFTLSDDCELVSGLLEVFKARTGLQDAKPLSSGGGTYARKLPNAVSFGPEGYKSEANAHDANEYITLEQLDINTKMIADAIIKLACK